MFLDDDDVHAPQADGSGIVSSHELRAAKDVDDFGAYDTTTTQLLEIQRELDELRERRHALEEQRLRLLNAESTANSPNSVSRRSNGPSASVHGRPPLSRQHSAQRVSYDSTSTLVQVQRSQDAEGGAHRRTRSVHENSLITSGSQGRNTSRSATTRRSHSVSLCNESVIPSEAERRRRLQHNVYYEMKEAMRRSWKHDSALVGGTFLADDCSKVPTFSRERRFAPLPGSKESYFLATDVEHMQAERTIDSSARERRLSTSTRGLRGANVDSAWKTSRSGGAPGPGAYTPRYQKVSRPTILARQF